MNTAPDSVDAGWSDKVGAFFTFGPGYTTGTYILMALGFMLFVAALIAWVYTEDQKLSIPGREAAQEGPAHREPARGRRRSGISRDSRPARRIRPGGSSHATDRVPRAADPLANVRVRLCGRRGGLRDHRPHHRSLLSPPGESARLGGLIMRRPSSTLIWIGVGAVAAVAAFALARHAATEPPEPLAVGAAAPRFALRGTAGERVAFAPPVARPLVLAFVGDGLRALRAHGPGARRAGAARHDRTGDRRRRRFGRRAQDVRARHLAGAVPFLADPAEASRSATSASATPTVYVLRADGRIAAAWVGEAPMTASSRRSRPLAVDLDDLARRALITTVVTRGGSCRAARPPSTPRDGMPRRMKRTATRSRLVVDLLPCDLRPPAPSDPVLALLAAARDEERGHEEDRR